MKLRLLTFILALTMLASILTGCSDSAETAKASEKAANTPTVSPAESNSEIAQDAAAKSDEAATTSTSISYPLSSESGTFTYWYEGDNNEETSKPWLQAEELTGIHVKITYATRTGADEQFNLMMASGEYTDIIDNVTDRYAGGAEAAIDENVILNLAGYLEKDLPDYSKYLYADKETAKDLTTDSGYIPAVYQLYDEVREPDAGPIIRQDWLDKLGLDTPETYDDYEKVLLAFKNNYNCSSPLILLADAVPENNYLVAGYGIAGKTEEAGKAYMPFYQVDGVVKYGLLEDGFKQYVTMLRKWYSEGLIAADYATADNAARDSLQNNEQCGIWYSGSGLCGYTGDNAMISSDDPNYHAVAIPDAVQKKGDINHLSTSSKYKSNHSVSITTQAGDSELIAQWLNFWFTDAGSTLANYGAEGEGCTIDQSGKAGFSDLILNNPDSKDYRTCLSLYTVTCVPYYNHVNRDMATYTKDVAAASGIWASNRDGAYNYPDMASLNGAEAEEFSALYADISTIISEQLPQFIMGTKSMDEWDSFVASLNDMKLGTCIELKQDAYDRYITR